MNRLPRHPDNFLAAGVALTTVASIGIVSAFNLGGWDEQRSTKALVADYESQRSDGEALVFFGRRPLSGAFYSAGRAEFARGADELRSRLLRGPAFVAIRPDDVNRLPGSLLDRLRWVEDRGKYRLFIARPRTAEPHVRPQAQVRSE